MHELTCKRDGDDIVVRIPAGLSSKVLVATSSLLDVWIPAWIVQDGAATQPSLQALLYRPSEQPVAADPLSSGPSQSTAGVSSPETPSSDSPGSAAPNRLSLR